MLIARLLKKEENKDLMYQIETHLLILMDHQDPLGHQDLQDYLLFVGLKETLHLMIRQLLRSLQLNPREFLEEKPTK